MADRTSIAGRLPARWLIAPFVALWLACGVSSAPAVEPGEMLTDPTNFTPVDLSPFLQPTATPIPLPSAP